MKILIIADSLSGGGAEKFCRQIHQEFISCGIDSVHVSIRSHNSVNGLIRKCISLNKKRFSRSIISLLREIWRVKPDYIISTIIHINIAVLFFKLVGMLKGTKIVIRHSNDVFLRSKLFKFPFVKCLYVQMLNRHACLIVSQTDHLRHSLAEAGVNNSNQVTLPNMIEGPIKFERVVKDYCIFVGRLENIKNLDVLLRCFSRRRKNFPKLYLLGDGTERNRLKAIISHDDLNAEILGWSDSTSEWISGAKFLLLPSLSEGFPNVVLESLQVNTPVISTPNSQIVKDLNKFGYCELTSGFNQADIEASIAKIMNGNEKVFRSKFEQAKLMSQFGAKHVVSTLIDRLKY